MKNLNDKNGSTLNQQNESLGNETGSLTGVAGNPNKVRAMIEIPLIGVDTGVKEFQKDGAIKIPSAWDFEREHLEKMLEDRGGRTMAGLMAYAMKDMDGYLAIALIPYYMDDDDKKHHFLGNDNWNAFDFSDMVPSKNSTTPNEHAVENDGSFSVVRATRTYHL